MKEILSYTHISRALMAVCLLAAYACQKAPGIGEDPYAGGKEPFGISFLKEYSDPEVALPGETVTFFVKGLKQYEGKFQFAINNNPVEIINTTDSTIQVVVPDKISSGAAMVIMENQFFNGPILYIEGNVSVDDNFDIPNGFNGSVSDILPQAGGNIVAGNFTDFENEASASVFRNGLHYINSLGKSDGAINFQRGTGWVNNIVRQGNKFIAVGAFSTFNRREASNIVRLNTNGSLDSVVVDVLNPTPERPENNKDTVSAFNGGALGQISHVFPVADNKLIAVGSFRFHTRIDYRFSSRETRRQVFTPVRHILRFEEDGSLDSAYMMNNAGGNGNITGAVLQEDDKVVLAGDFTSFNGTSANRIVRLDTDGNIDPSFAVGSGADGDIFSIQYNKNQEKMIITGRFSSFNGVPVNGVVVLDKNGNIDPTFQLRPMHEEAFVWFGHILDSGKIILSGSIILYDDVPRSSLLILNPDGSAEQKYNNIGRFSGDVRKVVETTSSLGNPAVLLGGRIFQVERKMVGNIVKLEIKD